MSATVGAEAETAAEAAVRLALKLAPGAGLSPLVDVTCAMGLLGFDSWAHVHQLAMVADHKIAWELLRVLCDRVGS